MPDSIIQWLNTASWPEPLLAFFLQNLAILILVVLIGGWLVNRFSSRRVAPAPDSLSRTEVIVAFVNVLMNTATTVAGLWLWRKGIIHFRTDSSLLAFVDVVILILVMDLLMDLLHRIAHTRLLFPILHKFHHQYERPRPLTLFTLNPVENLAFGGLWLALISMYSASWLGMSIYLILNVAFGTIGHLGVEPFPRSWVRKSLLRHIAGGSFHAQHHQDIKHNFGFYILIWDRLLGTLLPHYERNFGYIQSLTKE